MSAKPTAVIVIGASTGGPQALKRLVAGLPADLRAAVLIVVHVGYRESVLPQILAARAALPIRHAEDGDALEAGIVLVAPPDHHLLVESGKVRLSHGAKENHARPAVDPLFRSAAQAYRERVIGVILTGNLDDGTIGLQAVKTHGGIAVVQAPSDAQIPSMPQSAIDHVDVDYSLPVDEMAGMLVELVNRVEASPTRAGGIPGAGTHRVKSGFDPQGPPDIGELDRIGERTALTCPECHGVLWEIGDGEPQRFRCHTGHAYTARSLAATQGLATEDALWGAMRALHEKRTLMEHFARRAEQADRTEAAADYRKVAEQAARHSEMLRKLIGDQ